MKMQEPGHCYTVDSYDGEMPTLPLVFMKRVGKMYPGNQGKPHPGTNCQEVLRVLIDRVKYLDNQIPDMHNDLILDALQRSLYYFEERAAQRHGLFAEFVGRVPKRDVIKIENFPTCKICGHIVCPHNTPAVVCLEKRVQ